MNKVHQKLPNNLQEREKLREKGQFWTPHWVAEAMVEYVIKNSQLLFDPAVGKGAFYSALENTRPKNCKIQFYGTDIDENIISEAKKEGIFNRNNFILELRDFIFSPPKRKFKSIVANPPYIRHHRLPVETKNKLKEISKKILSFRIDARAGIHVYFLMQALNLLEVGGRLAFIMPADTCEGVFAKPLWNWIASKFCLDAVITFSQNATPFPGVDTNAIVFLIRNKKPANKFYWVNSKKSYSCDLKEFIKSDFKITKFLTLKIIQRDLKEALETGLSRFPIPNNNFKYRLLNFAKVMRGIATGDNNFFHLTRRQVKELKIPDEFLKSAIGRTKDVNGSSITNKILKELEKNGRPTLLFSPDGRKFEKFPKEVQKYLKRGELIGICKKALIKTRNPWYKMEQREIPKFLFAYLGRRNVRFLKNDAKVVPLTGFLCVYPRFDEKGSIEKFWEILNHSDTLKNLKLVGKSYGSGAIKVEPRALEKLPLPEHLVKKYNLDKFKTTDKQLILNLI